MIELRGRLVAGLMAACALASVSTPAPAHAQRCVALVAAHVYTPLGWKENSHVAFEGASIVSVGPGAPPSHCRTSDFAEGWITPGLIDVTTQVGTIEVNAESHTTDAAAKGSWSWADIRPSFHVAPSYNPRSVAVPVSRAGGLTSVVTLPQMKLVAGYGAWVQLAGDTQRAAIRDGAVALLVGVGGGEQSRSDSWHALQWMLEEAADFGARQAQWRDNATNPYRLPATELRALQPILDGKRPVIIAVNRAADIEQALTWSEPFGLNLIIHGGAEAWMLAERLGRAQVPVIVDPLLNAPQSFDTLGARADNAALLHAAGVPVVLSTFGTHNARLLAQAAGNAVRAGLSRDAAVDAMTRTPARVLGLDGAGRLEAGATADIVVWSGEPLELSSRPRAVFIGGAEASLTTRQTLLRDRYRHLPGRPAPLELPASLPPHPSAP